MGQTYMSKLEYKYAPFSLKTSEDGRGEFTGCANFCGYLDDGGDIIPQGGFDGALPEFLKGGFIAHSHEWNIKDGVIGYPVEAHEDENGLFIKGKFHSTSDAQDIRTKMKERADDGLDVGLSIGYRGGAPVFVYPKDYEKELPKYLKPQFLSEGLQKAKRFKNVRVLPKLSLLKEVSVVTSPMNILSSVDGVKHNLDDAAPSIEFAPLATEWNPTDALTRVTEWSQKQPDPEAAFASAFLLPDNNNIHRFPIADVLEDKLVYVERGLSKAVDDFLDTKMPDSLAAKMRGKISAFYALVGQQFKQEVRLDWAEKGDEVTSEIQEQSFKDTCAELGLEDKAGSRNSGPDRQRIKQMHDLATSMQPDVCPSYSSKAIINAEVKEIFDEELAKTTEVDPYRVWSAFCETLRRIKQIKASSNGQVDTDALLGQALSSVSDNLSTAAYNELNKDQSDDEMSMSMYGNTKPQESKGGDDKDDKDGDVAPVAIDEWKAQRFRTEKLKTGALRQRAGLHSGLGGA